MSFEVWTIVGEPEVGEGDGVNQAVVNALIKARAKDNFHTVKLGPDESYDIIPSGPGRGTRVVVHEDGERASLITTLPVGDAYGRHGQRPEIVGRVNIRSLPATAEPAIEGHPAEDTFF